MTKPGVAVRKEIDRLRDLIGSGRVRHPGAGLEPFAAEQFRLSLDKALPGVDITKPIAV